MKVSPPWVCSDSAACPHQAHQVVLGGAVLDWPARSPFRLCFSHQAKLPVSRQIVKKAPKSQPPRGPSSLFSISRKHVMGEGDKLAVRARHGGPVVSCCCAPAPENASCRGSPCPPAVHAVTRGPQAWGACLHNTCFPLHHYPLTGELPSLHEPGKPTRDDPRMTVRPASPVQHADVTSFVGRRFDNSHPVTVRLQEFMEDLGAGGAASRER